MQPHLTRTATIPIFVKRSKDFNIISARVRNHDPDPPRDQDVDGSQGMLANSANRLLARRSVVRVRRRASARDASATLNLQATDREGFEPSIHRNVY